MAIRERQSILLQTLRDRLAQHHAQAIVITCSDPHGSEYLPEAWQGIFHATGFSGEAATLVVTDGHAGLWTDSRYFIQAAEQLEGSGFELHKMGTPSCLDVPHWLKEQDFDIEESFGVRILVDSESMMHSYVIGVQSVLEERYGVGHVSVVTDCADLYDSLFIERPARPMSPITEVDATVVGMTVDEKLEWLRGEMHRLGCNRMLISALDEVAWLLNVRGSDIDYNPVVTSYILIDDEDIEWFVANGDFKKEGVVIRPYNDIAEGVMKYHSGDRIFVDPATLNELLWTRLSMQYPSADIVEGCSPIQLKKAMKTPSEIEHMRAIHIQDALAMERFLYWLETSVKAGERIDERAAELKLDSLRAQIKGFHGLSFKTISAYGPDAALPHYSTPETGSAVIEPRGLYLVDSGGQYDDGTTDITRTVPMGECSELEKEDYTLVLKGMIDLATAIFPRGTAGCQMDILARNPLWQHARNFGHGTGHGVGFYLCVHEGPQGIRQNFLQQAILPGMVTSDEPGLYREGMHGIRHENLILCVPYLSNEFGDWLRFEILTKVHFDTSAIIPSLLSVDEIVWLNSYNESVFKTLSPLLEPAIVSWLRQKTMPI